MIHPLVKDLKGKRFGRLIATNQVKKINKLPKRLCHCDCGKETWVSTARLINSETKSCGCGKGSGNRLAPGMSSRNRVLREYQRHAKDNNRSWELTDSQFDILTKDCCFFCGRLPNTQRKTIDSYGIFTYNGIDRLNNDRGYTIDNVVSCCIICNRAKNNMTFKDFMTWIQDVSRKHQS